MENNMTLQEQVNAYLNILRDSGAINMFGAAPHIEEEFDVSRAEAKQLLLNWMKSFSDRDWEERV